MIARPPISFAVLCLAFLCALLLSGCANLGYEDGRGTQYRIGPDKWIVYYEGSPDMSESLVLDYALNRCAQVALQLGYSYYKVLEVQRGGTSSSHYIPGMETSVVSVDPDSGPFVTTRVVEGRVMTSRQVSYSITIECYREPTEGALQAREVWDAFRAREGSATNSGDSAASVGGSATRLDSPAAEVEGLVPAAAASGASPAVPANGDRGE